MSAQLSTRSPRGCLTCKQRRKKCDETRPTCQRCKQGKFKCLGYAHLDSAQSVSKSWGSKSKSIPDTPLFSYEPIRLPSSDVQGLPPSAKASPHPITPTSRPQIKPPERRPQRVVPSRASAQQHFESIPRIMRFESENVHQAIQLVLSQLSRFGFRIFMRDRIQAGAAILRRVYRSDMLRWSMYLGAQIAQMLLDGLGRKNYLDLIRHFHRQVLPWMSV
ncbi:hypothetical protein B0J17DRAFT_60641 [Rhizoctonia solani]|nr:hypothetical protein B0J17DRAFT_60641 [Rhizoctonia solani]